MKYLDMVIKESLRLRPPIVLFSARELQEPLSVEGITLGPKTLISANVAGIGRDPELWQDPDTFLPERWLQPIPSEQFLPFFYGPRICIGKKFAMLEMATILATLYREFETELPKGAVIKPDPFQLALKAADDLPCTVRKRIKKY